MSHYRQAQSALICHRGPPLRAMLGANSLLWRRPADMQHCLHINELWSNFWPDKCKWGHRWCSATFWVDTVKKCVVKWAEMRNVTCWCIHYPFIFKILFFKYSFFCCCQICFKCNTYFLFFIIFFKHFSFLLFFATADKSLCLIYHVGWWRRGKDKCSREKQHGKGKEVRIEWRTFAGRADPESCVIKVNEIWGFCGERSSKKKIGAFSCLMALDWRFHGAFGIPCVLRW